jgi:hypothetical protein
VGADLTYLLAVDRLVQGQQQLDASEGFGQDLTDPELARDIIRGAGSSPLSGGQKEYWASVRFPDGLDDFLRTAGHRDVHDDEARFSSFANRLRQLLRGFNDDNGVTRLTQPAPEQVTNQVVRFDDKYVPLLLHDAFGEPSARWPSAHLRRSMGRDVGRIDLIRAI